MLGQQRLVGGHHMLAVGERGFDQLAGHAFVAADQLHNHVGVGIGQRQRIGAEILDLESARLVRIPRTQAHQHEPAPRTCRQLGIPCRQDLDHAAAHGAQPRDGDFERRPRVQVSYTFTDARSMGAWLVPMERNFFTLRAAWRMRCSFSTSATRT